MFADAGRQKSRFACVPRFVISGLSGGSGKTLLALALTRLFTRQNQPVKPFKKGPDYIDAAWLALAAHGPATNLDPYFLEEAPLRALFMQAFSCTDARIALIEGNRGLFDGRDVHGTCSTAALARTLDAPIILALNCTKMTRTAAAILAGLATFEPLRLAGVVLNRVGTARQGTLIRQCVEAYTDIPVLGELPRLSRNPLPERLMGLADAHCSTPETEACLEQLADLALTHTDVPKIMEVAQSAPPLVWEQTSDPQKSPVATPLLTAPVIGYVHDAALWFYYQENLQALRTAGARLVRLSLLDPTPWPPLDGLYLGGGFPENLAPTLTKSPHLALIRRLSQQGLPIYAECGGLMLLCASLTRDSAEYPMAGIFPLRTVFTPRPQGLGYVQATVTRPNPFHPLGAVWRGHEFHYSHCESATPLPTVLRLDPGTGMGCKAGLAGDGILSNQTFAAYTHLFAPAVPHWAPHFVAACTRS